MARRSEHSLQEIKEMVLEAAESIVEEEGYNQLKARKVAMQIGYTVGSVYMVFNNMSDLILHVNGRTLEQIELRLRNIAESDDLETEQIIRLLAQTYLSYAKENYNRWNLVFEHRIAENEELPDWYQAHINRIFFLVEEQFRLFNIDRDEYQASMAARALWAGVHGICALCLSGKMDVIGIENIEETVNTLTNSFINGWLAEEDNLQSVLTE